MIRLLAAALLAAAAVAPAFACDYNKPVQAGRATIVASQPSHGHVMPTKATNPRQG